jgi:hypothetical protein
VAKLPVNKPAAWRKSRIPMRTGCILCCIRTLGRVPLDSMPLGFNCDNIYSISLLFVSSEYQNKSKCPELLVTPQSNIRCLSVIYIRREKITEGTGICKSFSYGNTTIGKVQGRYILSRHKVTIDGVFASNSTHFTL